MAKKTTTKTKAEFDFSTIKGFEDACKKENIDPTLLPVVDNLPEEFRAPLIAAYKLMVGYKAMNNGVKMEMGNVDKTKYYSYFWVDSSGVRFLVSGCDYSFTNTGVGSRLCTDKPEKVHHMNKYFEKEFETFLL